jgi:cytidylate kinase
MGSVVFPQASVKIFLTASPEERARRRYKQLKEKGLDVSLATLVSEIGARDERDRTRPVSPLKAAKGAVVVDTSSLTIAEVLDLVLDAVTRVFPDPAGEGRAGPGPA